MAVAVEPFILALAAAMGIGLLVVLIAILFEVIISNMKWVMILTGVLLLVLVPVTTIEPLRERVYTTMPASVRDVIDDFWHMIEDTKDGILDLFEHRDPPPPTPTPSPIPPTATETATPTTTASPTATETATPTLTATPSCEVVGWSGLTRGNIRAGPGDTYRVIGVIEAGERFTVIERHPAEGRTLWYRVVLINNTTGWIFQSLVVEENCG